MCLDIERHVNDWTDEGQVADYLRRIVRKEAGDGTGLVYGMGHAVYTLSDPRARICHKYAFERELALLENIERTTPQVMAQEKGTRKVLCANIDLYTGFVYNMLGIPVDLYTPMFATARMAGWAAHRFEELESGRRIIRPAYKSVIQRRDYVNIDERGTAFVELAPEQVGGAAPRSNPDAIGD